MTETKQSIPEEKLAEFYQCVDDSTMWNQAALDDRQVKHIVHCLAPEVVEWARKEVEAELDDLRAQLAEWETYREQYTKALAQLDSFKDVQWSTDGGKAYKRFVGPWVEANHA